MGVEDTTKTDTRTETSDKPTSQERPSAPPPDNPGSPGQPSRLESRARAREQQQSRSKETQDTDTGSPPREDRDDKATTEHTGSGNGKTETSGRPEAEDQDRPGDDDRPGTDRPGRRDKREQEPRAQNEGTTDARQPGSGIPGYRDRPQAQTAEQRADTRAEPADRAASSERQWTPPPDNPGSPGQPSRLESRARAREQQQAAAAQRNESADNGSRPTEQRDNPSAPPQFENDGVKAEPASNAEGTAEGQDAGTPTDDAKTQDGPKPDTSEAPPTPEHNPSDADKPTHDARRPTGETTDQPTGPQEPPPDTTAGERASHERTTDPPRTAEQGAQFPDGPAEHADQPRPESADQPTSPANDTDQPHPTDPQTKPGDEPTGQNSETTEPTPDTNSRTDQPGARPSTDNAPPSPEEQNRDQETAESLGHQDDRGKKSEEPETTEPENENNTPDRASHQSGETEEPRAELAPQEANTAEIEEANRFVGRIQIAVDSDGRPIPASRDAGNDTADRGELRRPEDDPADRNPNEPDPERQSPIDRFLRTGVTRAEDFESVAKADGKVVDAFLRPPPTGKAEVGTGPYIEPMQTNAGTGNAALSLGIAAIVAVDTTRRAARGVKDGIRRIKEQGNANH